MKYVKARIPCGNSVFVREVELYSKEEAKEILKDKDWEIGSDIYSTIKTNQRIGWIANFGHGDGIYVEASCIK